jgi:tRNA(Ile)-lysidine synthetase-like protein
MVDYFYQNIYDFWFDNPSYWIPITNKDKIKVDRIIYEKFYNIDYINITNKISFLEFDNKTFIGFIIFQDQFYKHFMRHQLLNSIKPDFDDTIIQNIRTTLSQNIISTIDIIILQTTETELIFVLMLFKHIKNYKYVIENCYLWCAHNNRSIQENLYLSKFFNDTYKKMYDFDYIYNNVSLFDQSNYPIEFDPINICDYFPSQFIEKDWYNSLNFNHPNIQTLSTILLDTVNKVNNNEAIIISLSGGVDSMITLFILNNLKINKQIDNEIVACHIIYGNRIESNFEFSFIKYYCSKLNVKLFYYNIEYLTRKNIERDFYEKITRDIRFNLYKSVSKYNNNKNFSVYLGHIKDDVIENIWSNFSKGQHIFDLKKMKISTIQDGVKINRPFLNINKSIIFEIAHYCYIPYLKNTTPEWSNRGKFRNRFYKETHIQYGDSVDEKIIQVADTLSTVGNILDNLIYKPIYKSYNYTDKTIDVSRAIEAQLDINGWLNIMEYVCHNFLQITKPSIHSIKQFVERLGKNNFTIKKEIKFQIKSNLQVILYKIYNNNSTFDKYYIKFFI